MIGTSAYDTLHAKESYKRLAANYGARVCAYRAYTRIFSEPHFKETIRRCEHKIIFCLVGYYHHNAIVELRIK